MGKHLVLIGGGHAHMVTLANLHAIRAKGHRVSVVQPSTHHYYSGMGPGMLGGTYTPNDIRFRTRHVVEKQGGAFVHDSAVRVDAEARRVHLASGDSIDYDVLSMNAGSYVPRDILAGEVEALFTVKPIERLMEAQQRLEKLTAAGPVQVAIVGGGPSAVEVAGNVWQLARRLGKHDPRIRVYAGSRFMKGFPQPVRRRAKKILTKRGVEVLDGVRAAAIRAGVVVRDDGTNDPADFVFLAVGVRPSRIFADSGLPTGPDGGLLVNRYLQCIGDERIFGGGDCIYFEPQPLDKVGVYAVRQNPVLYANLVAALEGEALTPFDPGGSYLLIFNMGGDQGVLHKAGITFGGRLAFLIKDHIDRKFMRHFQALE